MPGFVAAAVAFAITAAAYFVAAFLGGGDVYKVASGGLTFGAAIAEKFLEPMFKKMLTDTVVGFIDTTRFDIAPLASAIGKVFVYTIAQIGALAACDFF